ncbi:rhodanese-like domain-containing protein, partial [Candidatus Gracilibacteria bacterium]|nr:rhodanese-like domain-containing protein [Candidatus Gracilibacteria bacterium]
KDEWDLGHIKGAIHIPLGDIMEGNYSQISKNTPVGLYCRSGRRADIALEALKKAGYTNIVNLGGITDIKNIEIVK